MWHHYFSKCHQGALKSLQASLEAEAKNKAEALRMKKKLESDINELEISLDHSNKAKNDLQKYIKKLQGEMKEMHACAEEKRCQTSEYRENLCISERRASVLTGELEEARSLLEQAELGRRQAESELAETHAQLHELTQSNSSLAATKRKLESEMEIMLVSSTIFIIIMSTNVFMMSNSSESINDTRSGIINSCNTDSNRISVCVSV